jgi:prophage maintenance system killer protein
MKEQVEIYKSSDNVVELQVNLEKDTVWLSQKQMALLFGCSTDNISLHIKNIFKTEELNPISVTEEFSVTANDGKNYKTKHYNLDAIISLGYRINSQRATQFRQWATQRLKEYLVQGYALNEKRLKEASGKFSDLQNAIKLAAQAGNNENLSTTEAKGIIEIIEQYAYALDLLDQYDHQKLSIGHPTAADVEIQKLSYENAILQIKIWRDFQNAGKLFGNEKDQSFQSSLETIYQTFDGVDLYPTIEEKAANLLYFIVKNHSFSDGNKRIAAGLFVYFLDRNNKLLNNYGVKRIGDNALVAITIMIAESKADEKETMAKLVVNLINNNN